MRCAMGILGIMAIAVLAANVACADGFVFGMNYFQFTNWWNGDANWVGPNFTDPNATTDGAMWIKRGSAAPVWLDEDFNFRLDFRVSPTSHWATVTNATVLGSGPSGHGPAWGIEGGYPGYFYMTDSDLLDTSPWRMGGGQYCLPGTEPTPEYPDGRPTQEGMQFNLYAWTGNFNTFFDAAAAGEHVAISGPFQVGPTMYWISPMDDALTNMPAVVLKSSLLGDANLDQVVNIGDLSKVLTNYDKTGMTWSDGDFNGDGTVNISDLSNVLTNYDKTATASAGLTAVPEPSSLALAAVGLVGLLAYARRKRR